MLSLVIEGDVILLAPCPLRRLQEYNYFTQLLGELSIGDIASVPELWSCLQKLINLHPRQDVDGVGFSLTAKYWLVSELLSQIKQLKTVSDLPESAKPQKPKTFMDLAIESSGDQYLDLFTDLCSQYGVDGASTLANSFGSDAINKIVFRQNAIHKPKEQRAQEGMEKAMQDWVNEDPEDYWSSLGLGLDDQD